MIPNRIRDCSDKMIASTRLNDALEMFSGFFDPVDLEKSISHLEADLPLQVSRRVSSQKLACQ